MILISHRGNISGADPASENSPLYIKSALDKGLNVEVDVWLKRGVWHLGHDFPQYQIKESFLRNPRLWCHAKNVEALFKLTKLRIHCFWHQEDDVVLTSEGYLWTYPGKPLTPNSICLFPERTSQDFSATAGICSDTIVSYL